MHGLNQPWEIEGNELMITEFAAVYQYVTPDGTVMKPENGQIILLVRCHAILKSTWGFSQETCLRDHRHSARNYYMICDPILERTDDTGHTYAFLFSVSERDYSGTHEDYRLNLCIMEKDGYQWSNYFSFWQ